MAERGLSWEGVANARDLGGLPRRGGGLTLRGTLARSGHLQVITPAGREAILDHHVGLVLDLRERWLVAAEPSPFADIPRVAYRHLPLVPAEFPLPVPMSRYPEILDVGADAIRCAFAELAARPEVGALFHCHSGTGRTGLLAMVLLALADVTPMAIEADYALSFAEDRVGRPPALPVGEVLATLERRGGVDAYLRAIGLDAGEVHAVRRRLAD